MSEDNKGKADEPVVPYGKEIVFFKSFEEMNDYDHKLMASRSPIERLQNITKMIMGLYHDELKNKMNDLTIHFK